MASCDLDMELEKSRSACSVLGQNIDISFGKTEHRSASGDGPLCAQHHALIGSIISLHLTSRFLVNARNLAESTELLRFLLCWFGNGSPPAGRVFEWTITLLCTPIFVIISTSCTYVLSLRGARSRRHLLSETASASAGPSTFRLHVSQWVSLRATGCSY